MRSHDGLMIIISSPSGAGKSTLARYLMGEFSNISFSVSATTRLPRKGEQDGKDYFFKSPEEFADMVAAGEMLEHAEVFDHRYGSPKAPVAAALKAGQDVLFDVDWQGAQQIRASTLGAHMVSVFVLPPSIASLRSRLQNRAQDSDEVVARRMQKAMSEISHWHEFDYIIVNDQVERAANELIAIVRAERTRTKRRPALQAFVDELQKEFEGRV